MSPFRDVTALLSAWSEGDPHALHELMPLVYNELRRIARHHWGGQPAGHILQPTALIHEAFLKMMGQGEKSFHNRTQFYAVASLAMRQILVNHAEASLTQKRGGGQVHLSIDEVDPAVQQEAQNVLLLHEASHRVAGA